MGHPARPRSPCRQERRRLQTFEQFLFDFFLLAVAADEVADEFARGRIGAALDAGAEGFGERDVHAGLRHGIRFTDSDILCQQGKHRASRETRDAVEVKRVIAEAARLNNPP
jgi:hypothetical protein